MGYLVFGLRLVLGGLLLAAGALKAHDGPALTANSIAAYRLLPPAVVAPLGTFLPYFEILLGGYLVLGLLYALRGDRCEHAVRALRGRGRVAGRARDPGRLRLFRFRRVPFPRNTRDNPFMATEGHLLSATLEETGAASNTPGPRLSSVSSSASSSVPTDRASTC